MFVNVGDWQHLWSLNATGDCALRCRGLAHLCLFSLVCNLVPLGLLFSLEAEDFGRNEGIPSLFGDVLLGEMLARSADVFGGVRG